MRASPRVTRPLASPTDGPGAMSLNSNASRFDMLDRRTFDPSRLTALGRLQVAITRELDAGEDVPCIDSSLWVTEDDYAERAAARACWHCPVLDACRRYVAAYPEPVGVWAAMTPLERNQADRWAAWFFWLKEDRRPPIPPFISPQKCPDKFVPGQNGTKTPGKQRNRP